MPSRGRANPAAEASQANRPPLNPTTTKQDRGTAPAHQPTTAKNFRSFVPLPRRHAERHKHDQTQRRSTRWTRRRWSGFGVRGAVGMRISVARERWDRYSAIYVG